MIDMHIHTTYSDGGHTVPQIVGMLRKAGVRYAAKTDHDTFDGVLEFLDLAAGAGIVAVAGVEISTRLRGRTAHLLGYGMDIRDGNLAAMLGRIAGERMERMERIVRKAVEMGLSVSMDDVLAEGCGNRPAKPHMALAVAKKKGNRNLLVRLASASGGAAASESWIVESCQAVADMIDRMSYLNAMSLMEPGGPMHAKWDKVDMADAISAVRGAGGYAVWAHPGHRFGIDEIAKRVPQLAEAGLAGVEAFHRKNSPEVFGLLFGYARAHGMLATAGSDFHGSTTPDVSGPGDIDFRSVPPSEVAEGLKDVFRSGRPARIGFPTPGKP